MDIYEALVISSIERALFYMVLALMTPEERLYFVLTASMMSNIADELTSGFSR